jgi:hypothetical protein
LVVLGFFQAVVVGLVSFAVSSVFGGLFFLVLRGVIRRRVEEWLQGAISDYIRAQLELSLQNPDKVAKTFAPIVVALMREALKDFHKGEGEGMVKIPFLGRVPASFANALIERFLGGSKKSSNEGGNPFA